MRIVSYILFGAIRENYSLGDSISDGSEELLEVRGSRYLCDLLLIKHTSCQKVTVSHKGQISPVMILALF